MRRLLHLPSRAATFLIECLVRGYQVAISPLLIGSCKFVPSCSEYFVEAVREWGVIRGSWLGVRRLLRCRPFTLGGIDPVPRRPEYRD
jgi:uncharacterized protein